MEKKDQRDLERVVPKALFLIEPKSLSESCTQRNPPSHSGMPLPLPPRLLPSPRAMRRVLPFARACPAASPNLPSAAARSCRAARRAATAARALVPRLERHESGAAGLWAERPPSAQPRIASMPTALPRRPKQARAMLTPFMLLTLSRRRLCASQIHKTT